jgi:hypothetical protein
MRLYQISRTQKYHRLSKGTAKSEYRRLIFCISDKALVNHGVNFHSPRRGRSSSYPSEMKCIRTIQVIELAAGAHIRDAASRPGGLTVSVLCESRINQQARQAEFRTLRGYRRQFVSGFSCTADGGERFDEQQLCLQPRKGSALAPGSRSQSVGPAARLLAILRRLTRG